MPEQVIIIAAVSSNGVIGVQGELPWRLPLELEHFKATTMGSTVLMGPRTFRNLPGRRCVRVSRTTGPTLEEALQEAEGKVFVAGGAAVYKAAIPYATRALITQVHTFVEDGDTFLPRLPYIQCKRIRTETRDPLNWTLEELF